LLARKFDAYIVPLAIFNQDNYKYKIKIYEPIIPIKTSNEDDDLKQISQLEANAISAIIKEDKKQWFWPHKRFKSHYKEIYEKNFNN
jgi:KDO2-lipid IV(A) lauroyltransferase